MPIRRKKGWELSEATATPESYYVDRCRLLAGMGISGLILAAPAALQRVGAGSDAASGVALGPRAAIDDPSGELYPVPRNARYEVDRPITAEKYATTYNNFYEFGSHKEIYREAQQLRVRPWEVRIDGLVEKETTIDIDQLLRRMPLEERVYRHRCVEAWSMTVPWTGFPMKALVDLARPLAAARYVEMQTFFDPEAAPGQRQAWYPWPYGEGLTIEETTNELAFLATGIYGKPLPKQNGAPLRLAVPWKYGFKSIKSIVRFQFKATRPRTFWHRIQSAEYGFWANVNPHVPHRRWSQSTERVLGTQTRIPTRLFNGYEEFVQHLYEGLVGERLFT
jgi:methionine sulfoxide reductase catalytic subunit